MWPLGAFTRENGATEIVPFSHRWERSRRPASAEGVPALASPGSVIPRLGSTLHGGGANRTKSERRGLVFSYSLAWLAQAEKLLLSTPPNVARLLPERAQRLVGYQVHRPNLGWVAVISNRHKALASFDLVLEDVDAPPGRIGAHAEASDLGIPQAHRAGLPVATLIASTLRFVILALAMTRTHSLLQLPNSYLTRGNRMSGFIEPDSNCTDVTQTAFCPVWPARRSLYSLAPADAAPRFGAPPPAIGSASDSAGHMVYLNPDVLHQLHTDMAGFYDRTVAQAARAPAAVAPPTPAPRRR
jgi:hypothetical protein